MKKCPFCAEEIQDEAVKCRFCNEFLQDVKVQKQAGRWYFSMSTLVIGFIMFGPFVLPLVWFNPQWSLIKKIMVTVIIAAVSAALWIMFQASMKQLGSYFDLLQGKY